jgi:hypothetical protein
MNQCFVPLGQLAGHGLTAMVKTPKRAVGGKVQFVVHPIKKKNIPAPKSFTLLTCWQGIPLFKGSRKEPLPFSKR